MVWERPDERKNTPMTESQMIDVLIVGAGPVGLTLACELSRRGISCRIVDQEPTSHSGSRARGLLPPTQDILEDIGVLDRLAAYVEPWRPNRFYDRQNHLLGEVDVAANMAQLATAGASRLPMKVSQQNTEATLREHLEASGVQVELNCQLLDFNQNEAGVMASVQHGDLREEIQARYLVGCDGGHSTVRKCAGIAFVGQTAEEEYGIVGNASLSGVDPMFGIWVDPNRPSGFLLMLDQIHNDTWYFTATLSPDEHRTFTPTLEGIQRFFDEQVKIPEVRLHKLTWLSEYHPQHMFVAERYRQSRVFLAGDAAHSGLLHGMETGIHDAYNLGWKLALVLAGASEALLDTYQDERRHIAQQEYASGGFSAGVRAIVTGLSTQRDESVPQNPASTPPLFGGAYRASLLSRNLNDTIIIQAGDLAPTRPRVQTNSGETLRLLDLLRGTHFTLLTFNAQPVSGLPPMPGILRTYTIARPSALTATGADVLIDSDGEAYRAYGPANDALVLVRPDGYVGLTTGNLEAQPVIDYLRDVTGGALAKTATEQGTTSAEATSKLEEATEESQFERFRKFHNF